MEKQSVVFPDPPFWLTNEITRMSRSRRLVLM
jgi:hypothetical protein